MPGRRPSTRREQAYLKRERRGESGSAEAKAFHEQYLDRTIRCLTPPSTTWWPTSTTWSKLAGIEHVGLGSDFDGVGDSLPIGLKSVADYPNLVEKLIEKGYSDADIQKILGGNVIRLWREVEKVAAELPKAELDKAQQAKAGQPKKKG